MQFSCKKSIVLVVINCIFRVFLIVEEIEFQNHRFPGKKIEKRATVAFRDLNRLHSPCIRGSRRSSGRADKRCVAVPSRPPRNSSVFCRFRPPSPPPLIYPPLNVSFGIMAAFFFGKAFGFGLKRLKVTPLNIHKYTCSVVLLASIEYI